MPFFTWAAFPDLHPVLSVPRVRPCLPSCPQGRLVALESGDLLQELSAPGWLFVREWFSPELHLSEGDSCPQLRPP